MAFVILEIDISSFFEEQPKKLRIQKFCDREEGVFACMVLLIYCSEAMLDEQVCKRTQTNNMD